MDKVTKFLRHDLGGHVQETYIGRVQFADEEGFVSVSTPKHSSDELSEQMIITLAGNGIRMELVNHVRGRSVAKRHYLGKQEIQMLIRYLQGVEPGTKDYAGVITYTEE